MDFFKKVLNAGQAIFNFFVGGEDKVQKIDPDKIEEVIKVFKAYDDYFMMTDFLVSICRTTGWITIQWLGWLLDGLGTIFSSMYSLGQVFMDSQTIQNFLAEYKVLISALFVLALVVVGALMMLQRIQDKGRVLTNILIAAFVLVAFPIIMTQLRNVTTMGVTALNTNGSLNEEVISANLTDLVYLAKEGFPMKEDGSNNLASLGKTHNIKKELVNRIRINEVIKPETLPDSIPQKYRSIFAVHGVFDENGKETLAPNDTSLITVQKEYYYRYHFRFFTAIATQIVTIITVLFLCVKVARIQFELLIHQMLVPAFAVTDIASGQRLKQILQSVFSSFAVMFICAAMLNLYITVMAVVAANFGGLAYILIFAGISLAVIDGPNFIEQLFGIDAGLQSVFRTALVAKWFVHQATRVAGQVKNLAGSADAKQRPAFAVPGAGGSGGGSGTSTPNSGTSHANPGNNISQQAYVNHQRNQQNSQKNHQSHFNPADNISSRAYHQNMPDGSRTGVSPADNRIYGSGYPPQGSTDNISHAAYTRANSTSYKTEIKKYSVNPANNRIVPLDQEGSKR